MCYNIIAIKIGRREKDAADVQALLTSFGCNIKVRLGLHDIPADSCSPSGLILLEVSADESEINGFVDKLNSFESVTAKYLSI
ncbi:MAG: hypothetical protein JXR63_06045 [Spirochaetales bacterium]|nr:hypothetical protein [Spirochaetales bacterium]